MHFDEASSSDSPAFDSAQARPQAFGRISRDTDDGEPPRREGLPPAFRMRHGLHYVEQLMGDEPVQTGTPHPDRRDRRCGTGARPRRRRPRDVHPDTRDPASAVCRPHWRPIRRHRRRCAPQGGNRNRARYGTVRSARRCRRRRRPASRADGPPGAGADRRAGPAARGHRCRARRAEIQPRLRGVAARGSDAGRARPATRDDDHRIARDGTRKRGGARCGGRSRGWSAIDGDSRMPRCNRGRGGRRVAGSASSRNRDSAVARRALRSKRSPRSAASGDLWNPARALDPWLARSTNYGGSGEYCRPPGIDRGDGARLSSAVGGCHGPVL